MHCQELERLLEAHSALTLEYFRQDGRTQQFYASDEEWVTECKRLSLLEEKLERLAADLADHRRQHGCDAPNAGLDHRGHAENEVRAQL
jgi:hypothetical protein